MSSINTCYLAQVLSERELCLCYWRIADGSEKSRGSYVLWRRIIKLAGINKRETNGLRKRVGRPLRPVAF